MKINQLTSNNYLYEGLDKSSLRSIKLWENAGHKLVEYQMTADQITQLFGQVEKSATAGGANRTMIGKGKDAADAVGRAWEDLKTKVQNSGPIKDIDAKYDQAAAKLKQATGGDQGVMKYVEKYRDFAKEHPIAQSLIYSALIAAAGISGAGAGGAAALGLLKMTDKLLQGEKFSSAAYSGAKTGAVAYGAGQIGKALQGGDQAAGAGGATGDETVIVGNNTYTVSHPNPEFPGRAYINFPGFPSAKISPEQLESLVKLYKQTDGNMFSKGLDLMYQAAEADGGSRLGSINALSLGLKPDELLKIIQNASAAPVTTESKKYSKAKLTEAQIKRMFQTAANIQTRLDEGVWDKVKGAASKAAGAVASKAQTIGTNLTTKVTADKLMTAWKKAGSPTDSDAVAGIMKQAGVDDAIIASSMKAMNGQQAQTGGAGAFGQMAQTLAPADADQAVAPDAQTQKFIAQIVASFQALTDAEKTALKQELDSAITASDVGSNVVKATNENRRRKKRSV
jgi:hypothetical protein